jgi:hypothetical protein
MQRSGRRSSRFEQRYAPTPAGLSVIVAWGTAYFRRYAPAVGGRRYPAYLPLDHQASAAAKTSVPAFEDTQRFPSHPGSLVLERNDCLRTSTSGMARTCSRHACGWRPTSSAPRTRSRDDRLLPPHAHRDGRPLPRRRQAPDRAALTGRTSSPPRRHRAFPLAELL